ncbi:MAG: hypothetical protein EXX96DRAFT_560088 [Benjaminiella poitrasii]|nr:MAG: hypothetical protein EXX96DRAFT_560088 [Benjaminiella poitrasii]
MNNNTTNNTTSFADPIITLSIELLPEFGFTVQDEPVYGPGSVFQGIVHLKMKESPVAADRLVLTFRGAEHATAIHDGHKFVVPLIKNPFFGMQQTLWQRTREDCLLTKPHYQFPFTIQMPMIQFPPSMEHPLYHCQFHLSAKLIRTTFTLPTVMAQQTIRYRPFIETRFLKQPVVEEGHDHGVFVSVRLHSLDYVADDRVSVKVTTSRRSRRGSRRRRSHRCCTGNNNCSDYNCDRSNSHYPSMAEEEPAEVKSILLELCETVRLVQCQSVSITRIRASHLYKPSAGDCTVVKTHNGSGAEYAVELPLPADLIPSINYSKIAQVTYTLKIKVKSRRRRGRKKRVDGYHCTASSLLTLHPFSLLRQPTLLIELPLKIGTLGYGIHASQDLKLYHRNSENIRTESSIPRFLRSIEYEDALPLYESSRLPNYVA